MVSMTPKDVDPKAIERFLRLAPFAAMKLSRLTGKIGTRITDDDLINEAFIYGHWWQYMDKGDKYFIMIIRYDMQKRLAVLEQDYKVLGLSGERSSIKLRKTAMTTTKWDMLLKLPSREPGPSARMEHLEFLQEVNNVTTLLPGEREFIRLRFAEGLPIKEIAKLWGVSKVTVYKRRTGALTKIRKALEGKGYDKSE